MYAMGYTERKVVKFQYDTTLWIWAGNDYQFSVAAGLIEL